MSITIEEMLPEIEQGRCILFLGSGSSADCESAVGGGLTAAGLTQELVRFLGKDIANFPTTLKEISEIIESCSPRHRAALDDFIHDRLHDLRPTIAHLLLTMFPWRAIVTTNFNQAVETGYAVARERGLTARSCRPVLKDDDLAGLNPVDGEIALFKPHGCISIRGDHDAPLVLTQKDYHLSIQKRQAIYSHIRELAQSHVTLFIGYSLEDYSFNNLYYELQAARQEYMPQSYAVQPLRREKAPYMTRSYASRRITLVDDKAEPFMVSLAHRAELLSDIVSDVAVTELSRPDVLKRLGEYADSLPASIRERLPPT